MTTFANLPEAFVNVSNLSDTNEIKFKPQPFVRKGFTDVYYKNIRVAIINSKMCPLQWTAPNGSNIPVRILDRIEDIVSKNLIGVI